MDLDTCIPADKFDEAAVERAAALGFPAINPILPDLLEWLQDINWPVAPGVAKLLAKAGVEIAPHINAVFRGDDGIWKYWILTNLAEHLKSDVWDLIEPEIVRLSRSPTPDDTAAEAGIAAIELLRNRAIPRHKFDEAAAETAVALGCPAINPILPDLLVWVQDMTWPVAYPIADILVKAGTELAPPINAVFRGDDSGWKYSILVCLAKELDDDVWALIKDEATRLACSPTDLDKHMEVDVVARECLDARSEHKEN